MAKAPSTIYTTDVSLDSVTMDAEAFDNALRNHGVRLIHWRAMRCPVGLTDQFDVRRSHDHHEHCSNGYIYRKVGAVTGLFNSNASGPLLQDPGFFDGSSVMVSLPRTYDDPSSVPVYASYADRFYLDVGEGDLCVPDWHTFTTHATGIDRLQFQAVRIEHVIDSHGREYDPSLYAARNGKLVWLTPDRPAPGTVCVAWYVYQPFFYVSRIIKEIRVSQTWDPITGQASVRRMPYYIILQRENVFKNTEIDEGSSDPRQQVAAESGGFGPR